MQPGDTPSSVDPEGSGLFPSIRSGGMSPRDFNIPCFENWLTAFGDGRGRMPARSTFMISSPRSRGQAQGDGADAPRPSMHLASGAEPVSNIAAFPPRTPKDRARAADLQNARDRMLVVAAELDRLVTVSQEGLRAASEQWGRTGT